MSTTKTAPKARAASKSAEIKAVPFTVKQKWQRITFTMERKDAEMLVGVGQEAAGVEAWLGITTSYRVEGSLDLRSHSKVSDPVKAVIALEEYHWQDILSTCKSGGYDVASAIRWALSCRADEVRAFRRKKAKRAAMLS